MIDDSCASQTIFVTGGNSMYPNFCTRLTNELRAILPFTSTFHVHHSSYDLSYHFIHVMSCNDHQWPMSLLMLCHTIPYIPYSDAILDAWRGARAIAKYVASIDLPISLS
jgi:actin-related protein